MPIGRGAAHAYRERSGVAKTSSCTRNDDDGAESWFCLMGSSGDFDRCVVTVTSRNAGRVDANIVYCEREVLVDVNEAFERAYERRTGTRNASAECGSNRYDPTDWSCEVGVRDRCQATITRQESGRIRAEIRYCERD
jgi:hypothetical protein